MKIIYLHQYFSTPEMNGGTRSYEIAKRMIARGHEVHVITSRRQADKLGQLNWELENVDGINVHWLPVPYNNKMSFSERLKAFVTFALKAGNRAIDVGGDLVFATSTPLTIAIPAVKAKKSLNVPMVFEVRDLWPELPIAIGTLKSPFTKYLAKRLEKYAYKNADHIIGLSPGMSEGVVKVGYPKEKVTTVPNSCDLSLFNIASDSASQNFRSNRDWLSNRPLVLYAGTMGQINGVSWLAELAAEVYKINSNIRFLVIGEGFDETKVLQRAEALGVYEKNFFMERSVPKKDVVKAFHAADICMSLFIPLKEMWSNSANKFFDALASGTPVAINYEGWQKNLIMENQIGLVLSESDIKNSANQLVDFLESEEQIKICRSNALTLAKNEFSRDRLANRLIDKLEDTVKR